MMVILSSFPKGGIGAVSGLSFTSEISPRGGRGDDYRKRSVISIRRRYTLDNKRVYTFHSSDGDKAGIE